MAVDQPNGSRAPAPDGAVARRHLLAAAALVPVAPLLNRHPGLDPGPRNKGVDQPGSVALGPGVRRDDKKWQSALARFRAAESALAALAGTSDDEAFGRALDRLYRALRRLFRTPAPDAFALAKKLDLLIEHEVWELAFAAPSLAALRRDAARLASA